MHLRPPQPKILLSLQATSSAQGKPYIGSSSFCWCLGLVARGPSFLNEIIFATLGDAFDCKYYSAWHESQIHPEKNLALTFKPKPNPEPTS